MASWNGFYWEFDEAELDLVAPPLCGREEMKRSCPTVGCGRRMRLVGAYCNAVFFSCHDCLIDFARHRDTKGKWWGSFTCSGMSG